MMNLPADMQQSPVARRVPEIEKAVFPLNTPNSTTIGSPSNQFWLIQDLLFATLCCQVFK